MILRGAIRGFGILDVLLILSFIHSNILSKEGGIIQYISDNAGMVLSFGSPYFAAVFFLGGALFASIAVSGVLMLFVLRAGVFLSLFQAPFRFLLIIPPSFFFVQNVPFISNWIFVSLVVMAFLELSKVAAQVYWLKGTSNNSPLGSMGSEQWGQSLRDPHEFTTLPRADARSLAGE